MQIQREENQSISPPQSAPVCTEDSCDPDVATDDERDNAVDQLDAAKSDLRKGVGRMQKWLIGEWHTVINMTTTSPLSKWNPGIMNRICAEIATEAVSRGTTAVSGAAALLPGAGKVVVGSLVEALGKKLSDKIETAILGRKPPTPSEIRADERKIANEQFSSKLSAISVGSESVMSEADSTFSLVSNTIRRKKDLTKSELKQINQWIQGQSDAANAVKPSGNALSKALLFEWSVDNAADAYTAKFGVDQTQWEEVNMYIFGEKNLRAIADFFWAFQLERQWQRLGLPTDQIDAWLANPKSAPDGIKTISGSAFFENAVSPSLLALAFFSPLNPRHTYLAEDGAFRLMCEFHVGLKAYMWPLNWQSYPETMITGNPTYTLELVDYEPKQDEPYSVLDEGKVSTRFFPAD